MAVGDIPYSKQHAADHDGSRIQPTLGNELFDFGVLAQLGFIEIHIVESCSAAKILN